MKLNKFYSNSLDDISKGIVYLTKHGFWVLIGKIFLMGCGLFLSIILTRLLSVIEYGEYRYFFSLFLIFAFFSLPASTNTIIRYVPQGYDWSFISLSKLRLKFSLLGSITFFILAINSYYSTDVRNSFVYIILALFFPIYHCFDLFEYFLQSKEKFRNLTYFQVSRAFIRLGATVLVCWLTRNAIYSIITFICITSIYNLFSYFNVKKTFNIKMNSAGGNKNEIYKMAITLSIFGLLPMISNHIDKILIGNYINTESLAIYSIGMLIGETINGLFKGMLSVLNPKLVFYKIKLWQYCFVLLLGTFLGFIIVYCLHIFSCTCN